MIIFLYLYAENPENPKRVGQLKKKFYVLVFEMPAAVCRFSRAGTA